MLIYHDITTTTLVIQPLLGSICNIREVIGVHKWWDYTRIYFGIGELFPSTKMNSPRGQLDLTQLTLIMLNLGFQNKRCTFEYLDFGWRLKYLGIAAIGIDLWIWDTLSIVVKQYYY